MGHFFQSMIPSNNAKVLGVLVETMLLVYSFWIRDPGS